MNFTQFEKSPVELFKTTKPKRKKSNKSRKTSPRIKSKRYCR